MSENQLQSFNIFINSQKLAFEQKNDKIKNLIDNLNLTNEQKSEILRYERNFQRYVNNIEISSLPTEKYITEYEKAKNIRNEKMRSILTIDQLKIIEE